MKIITLNTWGKCGPYQDRWNFFLDELQPLMPDILCLQEVGDDELTKKIWNLYRPEKLKVLHAYDSGLLILSRFPVLDHKILTYHSFSPLERKDERKAIIAKIQINEHSITVANTHLAWREIDRAVRQEQIHELIDTVKQMKLPALITGDLNDIPESSPLEETRMAGYKNLLERYQTGAITWDNQNLFIQSHNVKFQNRQIDYLLTHESLKHFLRPKSCSVIFNQARNQMMYPSDHYGLIAEFETDLKRSSNQSIG